MSVLAMLELDGDADALLRAAARLDELMPEPEGVRVRIVARTETGIAVFQLWESAEARARHHDDAGHSDALAESGIMELVTASRSRTFQGAELSYSSRS